MVKVFRRYRQVGPAPDHFERDSSRSAFKLFVLLVVLIVQVSLSKYGRWITLVCFVTALGVWAQLLRSAVREQMRGPWIGVVMLAAITGCLVFAPATSKDVNSYANYGRMVAEYGTSPYGHEPRDFAADVWYQRTSPYWSDTPSVYGPAFTAISAEVVEHTGDSFTATRLAFQGLAAASLLGAVALAARRLGWTVAMIGIGLNPLLLTFGVNDAHCDLLIGLAVLIGVLNLDRRVVLAGAALAFAALIKISLLPALFGAVVWLWFKVSKRAAAIGAASGAVVLSIGFGLGGGLDSLEALQGASQRHTRFSVWSPLHWLLTQAFGSNLPTHSTADAAVSLLASAVVLAVGLTVLFRHRMDASASVAVCSVIVAYQVLGAYTLSWYAVWSVPALMLLIRPGPWGQAKPLWIALGHGCWLAIAYTSGYGVIAVTIAVAVYLVRRVRQNRPVLVF